MSTFTFAWLWLSLNTLAMAATYDASADDAEASPVTLSYAPDGSPHYNPDGSPDFELAPPCTNDAPEPLELPPAVKGKNNKTI